MSLLGEILPAYMGIVKEYVTDKAEFDDAVLGFAVKLLDIQESRQSAQHKEAYFKTEIDSIANKFASYAKGEMKVFLTKYRKKTLEPAYWVAWCGYYLVLKNEGKLDGMSKIRSTYYRTYSKIRNADAWHKSIISDIMRWGINDFKGHTLLHHALLDDGFYDLPVECEKILAHVPGNNKIVLMRSLYSPVYTPEVFKDYIEKLIGGTMSPDILKEVKNLIANR